MPARARVLVAISLFLILSLPSLFFLPVCATSIFSDGFESGNTSAWSGVGLAGNGTFAASTDYAHHGTYSGKAYTINNIEAGESYKSWTRANGPYYGRAYFYFTAIGLANSRYTTIQHMDRAGYSSRFVNVYILNSAGTYRFQLEYYNNGAYSTITNTTISIQLNTWYCVESYVYRNDSAGAASMWVDGALSASATGLNNTGYADGIGLYYNGLHGNGNSAGATTTYVDCVVVDSSYIGPEISDSTAPKYNNVNVSTIIPAQICIFSCNWSDETGLSGYIFGTNNTGTFTNETWAAFSTNPQWANVTKTLDDTIGNVVSYLWYANDTSNNWSKTEQYNFTLTAPYRPNLQMTPDNVKCRKYLETFSIQINVTNAIDTKAFNFTIYYDPLVLNYSSVSWGELGTGTMTKIDTTNGILEGNIADSPITGNHWLLNITFQADKTIIWKDGLTNKLEGKIWFHQAQLNFTDNSTLQYVEGGINQIDVNQAAYTFLPIQGDVNNNGTVDVLDLRTVARYYDKTPADPEWPEASKYDLNRDNAIDIFDLIIVASNIGFNYI